jgi:hypothetical protein
MKKKFAIGLIALLSVSFIFFGCGDSGSGSGSGGGAVTINGSDLASITFTPYAGAPTDGAAVSATIEISDTIAGTVALATYTDEDNNGSFNIGDKQVITITLTAAGGFTFADTDITADDVVANALNSTVFPTTTLSGAAFDGDPGVALVVKVTYTVPGTGPPSATIIEAADLTGIAKYNVAPTGAAVGDTAFNTGNPGFTGTVALATGSVDQGTNPTVFDAGDTQVITITLTPVNSGYTFVGTSLDADDIAAAVLGANFTGNIASSGSAADPFVVTVTYTKPSDTPPPETDVIAAGDLSVITAQYNVAPDGNAVTSPAGDLSLSAETIIASGLVELALFTDNGGAPTFDSGDTQLITITLTAAAGYTFTDTAITAAEVVSAALGSNVTGGLGAPSIDENTGATLVVKVTYTEPDVVITAGDLSVITGQYNVAPDGNAVTSPAGDLTLSAETIIASGLVELADFTDNGGAPTFDSGDTQVVTITLTAAAGYTFTDTAITAAEVVSAALGSNVTGNLGAPSIDENTGATLVVKATHTES